MRRTCTATVKLDSETWIGWIEEVPGLNCQQRNRDELIETLKATLADALEFKREEALGAAGNGYEELSIAV
jgi:hypothetical protein